MLEVQDQDESVQEEEEDFPQFPNFLAGCGSGNFYAKGSKKCTGIQRLIILGGAAYCKNQFLIIIFLLGGRSPPAPPDPP